MKNSSVPRTVDWRHVKAEAAKRLPPGDPVREALLREPDDVPVGLVAGKMAAYLRLLLIRRTEP